MTLSSRALIVGALLLAPAVAAAQQKLASPRDTTRATIGGAAVLIDYGRPSRRNRVIFGELVPWDQVWRTGANAATTLVTDRDLTIGGTAVPAGTYTLYTLPSRTGAKLIINKQHGQWGTDYDVQQDLARLDLATKPLADAVEQFTIALEPKGKTDGVLRLSWEKTAWEIPIQAR